MFCLCDWRNDVARNGYSRRALLAVVVTVPAHGRLRGEVDRIGLRLRLLFAPCAKRRANPERLSKSVGPRNPPKFAEAYAEFARLGYHLGC